MGARSLLGPADVSDETLEDMVARWAGVAREDVTLRESAAEVVPYDLPAITTAGRYWVSGTAATPDGDLPFRFFVKHVEAWSRSPMFAGVPPELREVAAAGVPWRTEPLVYRSDLRDRLPDGLTMPRAVGVHDLDELSSAVWLEAVAVVDHLWSTADVEHAARLLGRLAASPAVRPLSSLGEADHWRSVRSYTTGRLAGQVVPLLHDDGLWQHPLLADAFGPRLRARLLEQLEHLETHVRELESVPLGTAHGDACTNNLLRTVDSPDLVLIDFGFWSTQPLGFDLGQLLLGDVQLGRRPAAELTGLERVVVPAYVQGLRDEGTEVDVATIRRAHALHMMIYNGLSAMPFELLGGPLTPEAFGLARERAALATFALDLVEETTPLLVADQA